MKNSRSALYFSQLGLGRLLEEPDRGERDGQGPGVGREPLVELVADRLLGQVSLVGLLVLLVPDPLEDVPEVRMPLGELADLLAHVGEGPLQVGAVVVGELAVEVEGLVQVPEGRPGSR